jgi:hypothetical protein
MPPQRIGVSAQRASLALGGVAHRRLETGGLDGKVVICPTWRSSLSSRLDQDAVPNSSALVRKKDQEADASCVTGSNEMR